MVGLIESGEPLKGRRNYLKLERDLVQRDPRCRL